MIDKTTLPAVHTLAGSLARFAHDYIEAARTVRASLRKESPFSPVVPMPAYFLAAHGVELSFKSFLALRGVEARVLAQEVGHDLDRCHSNARGCGLASHFDTTIHDERALDGLVRLQRMDLATINTKKLESALPSWPLVEMFAMRLHQAIAPLAGYRTFAPATFAQF